MIHSYVDSWWSNPAFYYFVVGLNQHTYTEITGTLHLLGYRLIDTTQSKMALSCRFNPYGPLALGILCVILVWNLFLVIAGAVVAAEMPYYYLPDFGNAVGRMDYYGNSTPFTVYVTCRPTMAPLALVRKNPS